MALLEVEDLRVAFGASTAVDGVSFSVEEGQIVGLVGESGCGKSVTSLAVMGLLPKGRGSKRPRAAAPVQAAAEEPAPGTVKAAAAAPQAVAAGGGRSRG
ncbi:ATP-binding cassette domain-containing protein, partial [Glycomyces albidus]